MYIRSITKNLCNSNSTMTPENTAQKSTSTYLPRRMEIGIHVRRTWHGPAYKYPLLKQKQGTITSTISTSKTKTKETGTNMTTVWISLPLQATALRSTGCCENRGRHSPQSKWEWYTHARPPTSHQPRHTCSLRRTHHNKKVKKKAHCASDNTAKARKGPHIPYVYRCAHRQ